MRGNSPFGGGKLAALVMVLILASAAGAMANGLQPSGQGGAIAAGRYVLTGRIVKVADGDTVTLRAPGGQRRIRLDSIDAPEAEHGAAQPGQPYAQAARRHLADLVAGKTLTAQCYEQDRYGRDVCALILPDGRSVNRLQVKAGYAWAYTARRGGYLRDQAMPDLQRQARAARRGLWAGRNAVQPWRWRYDCWRQRRCG